MMGSNFGFLYSEWQEKNYLTDTIHHIRLKQAQ